MARNKKDRNVGKKSAPASPASRSPETRHPADSELRFQHVLRNMVVARDQARRKSD